MKTLTFLLAILLPLGTFSATASGEATIKVVKKVVTTSVKTPAKAKSSTGTVSVPVKTTIKYTTGPKGTCYTMQKDKKTGKTVKKYVDKKLCVAVDSYETLLKKCSTYSDPIYKEGCVGSVSHMKKLGYKEATTGGEAGFYCPTNFKTNTFRMPGSLTWCEPVMK